MFTAIMILFIPFLTVALLPVAVRTHLSSDQLDEMGICLEDPEMAQSCGFMEQPNLVLPKSTIVCAHA